MSDRDGERAGYPIESDDERGTMQNFTRSFGRRTSVAVVLTLAITIGAVGVALGAPTASRSARSNPASVPGAPIGRALVPAPLLAEGMRLDLSVPLYHSRLITLIAPANRVSVANPRIADIVVISPTQIYVLGKDIGSTNVLLWDRRNRLIGGVNVEVQFDLNGLKRKLAELLPGESIEVRSAQRSIVLSGHVSSAVAMDAAVRIASTFLAAAPQQNGQETAPSSGSGERQPSGHRGVGEVINLLQVDGVQQVMLQVTVAEIARTEVRRLDAQFNSIAQGLGNWHIGGVNGGAAFPPYLDPNGLEHMATASGGLYGPAIGQFTPNTPVIQSQGLFASFLSTNFLFNLALDAAKENGLARILAEPTLTTLSGQEADFVSGGEFPIPVPQGFGNTVTIQFKKFGIVLKCLPVVLNSGHINLKMNVSVSQLESGNTVQLSLSGTASSFVIPSLSERSASGVVELGDGQTIGLAGLLSENTQTLVTKFPGLGDIPVLGALFRSQDFQNGETELVILVTPRLAKPLPDGTPRLPTDAYKDPSDADFYLRGLLESPEVTVPATAAPSSAPTDPRPR